MDGYKDREVFSPLAFELLKDAFYHSFLNLSLIIEHIMFLLALTMFWSLC